MGKASKRRTARHTSDAGSMPSPAPFVRLPFAGLPDETEWLALREILPAATARVRFAPGAAPDDAPTEATLATVLPLAWPALHRTGGDVLVSTQAGGTSGDASRDLAAAWLLAASAPEGTPVTQVPTATAATPRLQELLDLEAPFEVSLHEGFDFWVGEADLDEEASASLQAANDSIVPTVRVVPGASVFWVRFGGSAAGEGEVTGGVDGRVGGRCYIRWVLGADEDRATDGLARLAAAGRERLTADARLLGAFRASGLLVPVWEVDPAAAPVSFAPAVEAMRVLLDEAIANTTPLSADERRARSGLLSRQVTLR